MSGVFIASDDDPYAILDGQGTGSSSAGRYRLRTERREGTWPPESIADDPDEVFEDQTAGSSSLDPVDVALHELDNHGYELVVVFRSVEKTEIRVVFSDQVFVVICRENFPTQAPAIYLARDGVEMEIEFEWNQELGLVGVLDHLFEEYRTPIQVVAPEEDERPEVEPFIPEENGEVSAPEPEPTLGDTDSSMVESRAIDNAIGDSEPGPDHIVDGIPPTIPPEPEDQETPLHRPWGLPGWDSVRVAVRNIFSRNSGKTEVHDE